MSRIDKLEAAVRSLYDAKVPGRDGWADWLYENHVFLVADKARELAVRFDADPDLCQAAGMLHDVADAEMPRSTENHEERSTEIARELLAEAGFSEQEIGIIVDDAIKFHSCHGGDRPRTQEGKVMATADAVVHLSSDFYLYAFWGMRNEDIPYKEGKAWARKKIDRDYKDKILLLGLADEVKPFYDALRNMMDGQQNTDGPKTGLREAKLFTDGGSRGNPGPSAVAFVICKTDNSVVEKSGEYIGETTNNQAEYQALKMGLKRAQELGIKDLIVNMDSELVVKQINGLYKMKNADLRPHYEEVKQLEKQFEKITFNYVPRALNADADAELNRILDDQEKKS